MALQSLWGMKEDRACAFSRDLHQARERSVYLQGKMRRAHPAAKEEPGCIGCKQNGGGQKA
jgi:hypothetical protein